MFSLKVIHFYVDSLARNCQASKAAVFQVIGIRDTVADHTFRWGGGEPGHPDPEIGGAAISKNIFLALWAAV